MWLLAIYIHLKRWLLAWLHQRSYCIGHLWSLAIHFMLLNSGRSHFSSTERSSQGCYGVWRRVDVNLQDLTS